MDTTKAQQKAWDDALVAPKNRLMIRKCNQRLSSTFKSNEPTIQVALDALKLTPFYNAFEVSADVPEIYMQEFWATVTKHHYSLRFKLNGKSHTVNVDNFRYMLKICPKLPGQKSEEPPFEEEILPLIRDLGHTGDIKEKQPATKSKAKGLTVLSEVALSEDEQMKLATKRSRIQTHSSHASGSGDGVDTLSKVPDEQPQKKSGTDERDGDKPKVPDVPEYNSDSEEESWTFSDGDDDDDDVNEESDAHDDSDENESDDEGDDFVHPNLSTYTPDDQDEEENVEDEEKAEGDEDMSDQRVHTPPDYQLSEKSENQEDDDVEDGEEYDDEEMLYGDLNLNRERIDAGMTEAHATKDTKDANVNPTAVTPVVQQQSSSVSDLVSKFINPSTDEGIDSVLNQNIQSDALVDIPVTATTETPPTMTTTFQPPFPNIHSLQQTPNLSTSTTFPTTNLPEIPNFASLFGFEQRVSSLEIELSEVKQTNQFVKAVSSIPGIVDNYLASKMKEAVDVVVQLKSNKLIEETQGENQDFINSLDSNMNKIIKEQVKAQTSKIISKVKKYVTKTLGAEVLVRSTNQPQTSYAVASSLSELELKKILMDKKEENKLIDRSKVQKNLYNALVEAYNIDKYIISTYGDVVTISRGHGDEDKDEEPSAGSNRGTKRRRSGKETESTNEPTHKESRTTSSSRGASRSQPTDLDDSTHQEFNTRDEDVTPTREAQDERQWHPSSSPTPDREWHLTKTVSDLPPQPWITHLAQAAGSQSSFDELMATPIDFSAFMMNRLKIDYLTQELLTGPTYDLMKGSCKSVAELEYHLEEVFKATNDQLDWNNPEGTPYPHDLSKPLPLILNARGRLVIPFDHFINNDLEYLKGGSLSHKYTTSITKTKAADYGQIKWIEDRIPKIISLKIMKFYGYSHLEEITVRRQDDKLYKLREGDFKRLRR
ncbi:hypothetical protein Tco_1070020 [Tanacetum coccineum]|uniref:Uncharacterized protein n=1 Tax=Tanacetum coccineum TaxID=301880 RepID=A0ABQ5HK79_9ASTR